MHHNYFITCITFIEMHLIYKYISGIFRVFWNMKTWILHEIISILTEFDGSFRRNFLFSMRITGNRPRRHTNVKNRFC